MPRKIELTSQEMQDCVDIHKKMMEAYASHTFRYNDEKCFELFSLSIALTISCTMTSLGIKNIRDWLTHLNEFIESIHEAAKDNSSFMTFKKGKKVSEGKFN